MVVGAAQLHVHRLAAVAVADHDGPALGPGFPSVPPVHQCGHGREQVVAFFGEQVLMAFALPGFAIGLALEHAVLDEGGESESASTIAATLGVSRATVYRVLAEHSA